MNKFLSGVSEIINYYADMFFRLARDTPIALGIMAGWVALFTAIAALTSPIGVLIGMGVFCLVTFIAPIAFGFVQAAKRPDNPLLGVLAIVYMTLYVPAVVLSLLGVGLGAAIVAYP